MGVMSRKQRLSLVVPVALLVGVTTSCGAESSMVDVASDDAQQHSVLRSDTMSLHSRRTPCQRLRRTNRARPGRRILRRKPG